GRRHPVRRGRGGQPAAVAPAPERGMMELREHLGGRRWRRLGSKALVYLALALLTVVMLYPFYYMGLNGFRSLDQYYGGHGFSLSSWRDLFKALPVGRELVNSTVVTVGAIALILAASTTAGYA